MGIFIVTGAAEEAAVVGEGACVVGADAPPTASLLAEYVSPADSDGLVAAGVQGVQVHQLTRGQEAPYLGGVLAYHPADEHVCHLPALLDISLLKHGQLGPILHTQTTLFHEVALSAKIALLRLKTGRRKFIHINSEGQLRRLLNFEVL